MKTKTFITTVLMGISIVSLAQDVNFDIYNRVQADAPEYTTNKTVYSYMTDELWVDYLNALAATNKIIFNSTEKVISSFKPFAPWTKVIDIAKKSNNLTETYAQYDTLFSEAGMATPPTFYSYRFPKCLNLWFDANPTWCTNHIVEFTILNRNPVGEQNWSDPEAINVLAERLACGTIDLNIIQSNIKKSSSRLVKAIKRYLREHGETFVVGEDGVNPVQNIVDQYINIMQSPNHSGLKQFIATYYPHYEWVDVIYLSQEDGNQLKDDVFYGEKDLTKANSVKLQTFLGLDAYNTFIEEYNNGSKKE